MKNVAATVTTLVLALLLTAPVWAQPSADVELTRAELDALVASSDKQRFAISPDGRRIRANQGHSVQVELGLAGETPPDVLYHGTVERNLDGIRKLGLVKGSRHHVHLSADIETATKVGGRRGKPVVLAVKAREMVAAGHTFYRSANNVWLVDAVPAGFIELEDTVAHTDLVPRGGGTVSRAVKIEIAKQSLAACDAGFYTNARGERDELAAAIEEAKSGTGLYELGVDRLSVPTSRGTTAISVTGETTIEALVRLAAKAGAPGLSQLRVGEAAAASACAASSPLIGDGHVLPWYWRVGNLSGCPERDLQRAGPVFDAEGKST